MRKKKGKIKADDASHIFLGAKLLGKRRKERQMQQIIVFIMRKCEKKKKKKTKRIRETMRKMLTKACRGSE